MTKGEFITYYMTNSGIDPKHRTAAGFTIDGRARVALPCRCGDEQCHGWAMIPLEGVAEHLWRNDPLHG